MRAFRTVLICFVVAYVGAASVHASPTSADWDRCHKRAVRFLEHCLDGRESDCFTRAEKENKSCYRQVHETYNPGKRREIERIKKAEEMKRRQGSE